MDLQSIMADYGVRTHDLGINSPTLHLMLTLDSLYGWIGTAREKTDELLQKVKEHDEQNDSNLNRHRGRVTTPFMTTSDNLKLRNH